ncbi:hypothetical protein [Candidatus Accumulibacter sp. ACC012]|nr:hypothetical protein [Candidatus Accumulibacter sp. ACC012]
MFIEKLSGDPHHIEIQLLADSCWQHVLSARTRLFDQRRTKSR